MLRNLVLLTVVFVGLLLLCTTAQALSFYKVKEDAKQSQWYAEGFGTKAWWLRERIAPYNITYIKIQTSDGQVHKLRNVNYGNIHRKDS